MNELYSAVSDWLIGLAHWLIALIVGTIVTSVAGWLWLGGWFNPPAAVVFVGVTAITWFALNHRPAEDPELERMLRREGAENG